MKKALALFIAVLMLGAVFCACSSDSGNATPANPGNSNSPASPAAPGEPAANADPVVFRMLYDVENTTLNYLSSGKELEHAIACNIVDGLVEFDNHSNIVPGMAESWETSEDGTVWTFHLRQGQYWYDNNGNQIAEVTANDWVEGLRVVATPLNDSGTYDQIKIVKGVEDYFNALTAGEEADFANVGVKAIDDYTLEYTLNRPTPYFLGGLAYACWLPVYAPLIEATMNEEDGTFGFGTSIDKIYSNGAFILTEWEPQVKQTFVKNVNNWDADRVYLDRIEKSYNAEAATLAPTMVLRDEIDYAKISNDILDDWKANNVDYLSKSREDAMWHYFYAFDFRPTYPDEYGPVDYFRCVLNSNFRHAIMSALNREFVIQSCVDQENPGALIQNTFTPANSCFTPDGKDFADMPAFDGIEANFYDPAKAQEYKAKAMEELSAQGVQFPVTLVLAYQSGEKNYENECIVVKQQLEKELGTDFVKFELWAGPSENFLSETRGAGKYSIMRVRWGADYIDPQTWTDPFSATVDVETGRMRGNSYNRWNSFLYPEDFRYYLETIDTNSMGQYVDEFMANPGFAEIADILARYDALVLEGIEEGIDINKRFEKFAEAEALLINNAMIIPCYIGPANYQATKLNVFEGAYAACGYTKLTYKGMKLQDEFISMDQYTANQVAWANGDY